ncbi:MAG TPA: GNAT family N-acetyltransferase [Coriobacteriia bacterium]
MRIEYLADHPSLVPELALLHLGQWGYLRPDQTLEERTRRLQDACGRGGVPTVVVALEDDALCGSAMLIANDMDTRPDLTPWLAGVYVIEHFRGRGCGTGLVARVESEASAIGVERLYLYTPSAAEFYARLGWTIDERCEYLGQEVGVMSKRVDSDSLVPAAEPG